MLAEITACWLFLPKNAWQNARHTQHDAAKLPLARRWRLFFSSDYFCWENTIMVLTSSNTAQRVRACFRVRREPSANLSRASRIFINRPRHCRSIRGFDAHLSALAMVASRSASTCAITFLDSLLVWPGLCASPWRTNSPGRNHKIGRLDQSTYTGRDCRINRHPTGWDGTVQGPLPVTARHAQHSPACLRVAFDAL